MLTIMKTIYLDNAATTQVRPEVQEAMLPYMGERYGNPSSLYSMGRDAREAVEESRRILAKKLNVGERELIFTSGGTESNNLAIKGIAFEKKGGHIITTKIEHSSILNPCKWLQKQGYKVTYVGVDPEGIVNPDDVEKAVQKDTILITVGHANNEIGTIQDLKAIGEVALKHNIPFHTDACQSFTKTELDAKKMNLSLVTINGHKINGPKGVGALAVKAGVQYTPLAHGGEHEFRKRGGTENVPGVVGFAKAAQLVNDRELDHMRGLRDRLIDGILNGVSGVRLNGHRTRRLCNNANFTFSAVEGEALLLRLDMKGICASTGSACSSQSLEPSHVILALGCKQEESHGSLRVTVGYTNTGEEIDYAIQTIKQEVEALRKISPFGR